MAGFNARFLYDQCTYDQNLKITTNPCRYQLLDDKFENQNMTIKHGPCENGKNIGCKKCSTNKVANIEAKWTSIGLRTDIESDLLIINRPNTRCDNLKYHKCSASCDKKDCKKKCPEYVVVNTTICDRHIVPTNLSMPLSNGF